MRLVVGQSLRMIAAGMITGTLGALVASRLLQRFVDGVRPIDPSTLALMVTLLAAAALLATFIPAHRASRLDAMTALRSE
jgi:putative ABC transport system permease protein